MSEPSTNGRDGAGRFVAGNPGGPGNPYASKVARLRSALYDSVTPEDVASVVGVLLSEARGGNVHAIKELLDRLLGKPAQTLEALSIELPRIGTAADAVTATSALLSALARGEVTPEDAGRISGVISGAVKALELHVLEARMDDLERASIGARSNRK